MLNINIFKDVLIVKSKSVRNGAQERGEHIPRRLKNFDKVSIALMPA